MDRRGGAVVTAFQPPPDPLEAARLAAEAAEAEVRACAEALAAARLRSLEAYAEWVSAVRRAHAEALRALR
jgi:vacuolar-type H+-ATPase subunit E/Vma4